MVTYFLRWTLLKFFSSWIESTKSSAVGPNHRAVINTSNEVKSPLQWEFWIFDFSLRILERVLGWKHCKYKEWVSFFLGSWGMNRSAEQTNRPRTASRFTRFVCPALRFIPHEPRKKDTHSLNICKICTSVYFWACERNCIYVMVNLHMCKYTLPCTCKYTPAQTRSKYVFSTYNNFGRVNAQKKGCKIYIPWVNQRIWTGLLKIYTLFIHIHVHVPECTLFLRNGTQPNSRRWGAYVNNMYNDTYILPWLEEDFVTVCSVVKGNPKRT